MDIYKRIRELVAANIDNEEKYCGFDGDNKTEQCLLYVISRWYGLSFYPQIIRYFGIDEERNKFFSSYVPKKLVERIMNRKEKLLENE